MATNSNRLKEALVLTNKSFKLLGSVSHDPVGALLMKEFQMIQGSSGTLQAIKQLKAYYQEATRFSCGLKIIPSTPKWVKRDKDLFPIFLKPIKGLLREGGVLERRKILSLLRTFEVIETTPVPDLSTVIDPSNGAKGYASIKTPFEQFLATSRWAKMIRRRSNRVLSLVKEKPVRLHYSTKKGVKGPTCGTAGFQTLAVNTELADKLERFSNHFNKEGFRKVFELNRQYFSNNQSKDIFRKANREFLAKYIGRIAFVPDKGGKTRLIAIGNYWVQQALKGLHSTLYSILEGIPTDGTYNQTSQFERVRMASSKGPVWSYDLTAATDRFPIDPQQSTLALLSPEISLEWREIMDSLTFVYEGKEYSYAVGQPMGLYSSWASFTLTHHAVIQFCAWQEEKRYPFESYAILGDDVAIWDEAVAKRYVKCLSLLDVNINNLKSYVPESLNGPCVAEFAKRISDKGVEITGISPAQTIQAWKKYYFFPEYIEWLSSHGFDTRSVPVSRVVEMFGVTTKQSNNLVCSLRIWELLRSPVLTGVSEAVPDDFKKVTKFMILSQRLKIVTEQTLDLWSSLGKIVETNRAGLDKVLVGPAPEGFYFNEMITARINQVSEIEQKLYKVIPYNPYGDYEEEELSSLRLSDVEYLPKVSLDEMMKGITHHQKSSVYRGRYIQLLLRELKALA